MADTKTPGLRVSPFCGDLRTKRTYFLEAPAMTEDEVLDGSGRAWCRRTMQSLGPDGEIVDPGTCQRGRDCFKRNGPEA